MISFVCPWTTLAGHVFATCQWHWCSVELLVQVIHQSSTSWLGYVLQEKVNLFSLIVTNIFEEKMARKAYGCWFSNPESTGITSILDDSGLHDLHPMPVSEDVPDIVYVIQSCTQQWLCVDQLPWNLLAHSHINRFCEFYVTVEKTATLSNTAPIWEVVICTGVVNVYKLIDMMIFGFIW